MGWTPEGLAPTCAVGQGAPRAHPTPRRTRRPRPEGRPGRPPARRSRHPPRRVPAHGRPGPSRRRCGGQSPPPAGAAAACAALCVVPKPLLPLRPEDLALHELADEPCRRDAAIAGPLLRGNPSADHCFRPWRGGAPAPTLRLAHPGDRYRAHADTACSGSPCPPPPGRAHR